ncbi:MAG: hypothetical protein H0W50_06620 [Parachlamydiaceae bacterium]|nr:hypothetical protein [Parachlamydiaceae bacterium]
MRNLLILGQFKINTLRSVSTNASAFLWTELKSQNKPLLPTIADKMIIPWNFSAHPSEINSRGFPKKLENKGSFIDLFILALFSSSGIKFSSFGLGFAASLLAKGTRAISFLPSFTSLVAYTAGSLSSKVILDKLNVRQLNKIENWVFKCSLIAISILVRIALFTIGAFYTSIAIQASIIGFTTHPIDQAISFMLGLPRLGGWRVRNSSNFPSVSDSVSLP